MNNLRDILQKCVNTDYENLVELAQTSLIELLPACRLVDPDNDGFLMVSGIILSALAADGVLTNIERKFVCDVLGIDNETFSKFLDLYNSDLADLVDKFADSLDTRTKAATLSLVSAVAACDEKITVEETAFIKKILE